MGESTSEKEFRHLSRDDEYKEKKILIQHLEEVVEKLHTCAAAAGREELPLSDCLAMEAKDIEKAVIELVKWENP